MKHGVQDVNAWTT